MISPGKGIGMDKINKFDKAVDYKGKKVLVHQ